MWSVEYKNIAKAIGKSRNEFEPIVFDKVAGGTFKYKYATLGAIYDVIMHVLFSNNITVTVEKKDNKAIVRLTHFESGEWFESECDVTPDKEGLQGLGGAHTYLVRYIIRDMLCIYAEEDTDGASSHESKPYIKPISKSLEKITAQHLNMLEKAIDGDMDMATKLKAFRKINKLEELPEELFPETYAMVQEKQRIKRDNQITLT